MARMQDVESSALKKPILSGAGTNNGATANSAAAASSSRASGIQSVVEREEEEDREMMEERADRKKTNWRLFGLGTFYKLGRIKLKLSTHLFLFCFQSCFSSSIWPWVRQSFLPLRPRLNRRKYKSFCKGRKPSCKNIRASKVRIERPDN